MNAENQTLQNREPSRATKKEQERRPSVKRYHAICEALSLGKKNGEVETHVPPLLSHRYGFLLAVFTSAVGEASNGDAVHPHLRAPMCAI